MADAGTGRAGGKLVLCGEHAVVHGWPAIALGVDRGTTVTLERRPGPTRHEPGGQAGRLPHGTARVSPAEEPPRGAGLSPARLERALRAVLPEEGIAVRIASDLPMGRGMGSSAALAVALVRAEADLRGAVLTPEEEHARAFAVERVFHGNPSGLDHAVAARGGAVRYRREPLEIVALPCPTWSLVVLDSGTAGDTAALVAAVTARRPGIDPVLARIGALVGEVEAVLDDPAALGPVLLESHHLLSEIGVSTAALDGLVDLALAAGAHGAKLSGAGGGGVVLAVAPDPERVLRAARRAGVDAFEVRTG